MTGAPCDLSCCGGVFDYLEGVGLSPPDDVEPLRAEIESFLDSVRSGSAATGKTGQAASQTGPAASQTGPATSQTGPATGKTGMAGVSAEDGYAAVEMAERITNIIKDQAWTTAPA